MALWNQLRQTGFCFIRGTGLSKDLCQSALTSTNSFLNDAPESVRRSALCQRDRARRGYSPSCTENFASLIGQSRPNDLVRKFRIGMDTGGSQSSTLHKPNVWPKTCMEEEWEGAKTFQQNITEYYEQACPVADAVVEAICDAAVAAATKEKGSAPVDESTLRCLMGNSSGSHQHTSILTLLGYHVGSRHRRRQPSTLVAPHTDVGVITMLIFDAGDCATLQRKSAPSKEKNNKDNNNKDDDEDDWIDVSLPPIIPEDPIFVVNIGDCLSQILQSSSGLPSTLHRVIPRKGRTAPRNCLALFVGLEPDQIIHIPEGKEGEETMTYEEWRKRRIAQARSVLLDNQENKLTVTSR